MLYKCVWNVLSSQNVEGKIIAFKVPNFSIQCLTSEPVRNARNQERFVWEASTSDGLISLAYRSVVKIFCGSVFWQTSSENLGQVEKKKSVKSSLFLSIKIFIFLMPNCWIKHDMIYKGHLFTLQRRSQLQCMVMCTQYT